MLGRLSRHSSRQLVWASVLAIGSFTGAAAAGPLHDAVRKGDVAAVDQIIADGADIEETDYFVGPALLVAVSGRDAAIAAHLIEQGADVEAVGERQRARALHLAAELADIDLIEVLLTHGADVDARDADGRTPLIIASEWGATGAAARLLEHGAAVDSKDQLRQQTALHRAAENGHVEVVQKLLDHGAPVDAADQSGFTPFMLAAQSQSFSNVGSDALLRLLADQGANIHTRNAHGQTPLEYARSRNDGAWRALADALQNLEGG